jgi:hypothetical protein
VSEIMERVTRNRGKQFKIWIPDDVHEWLKQTSAKNERSMTYLTVKALRAEMKEAHENAKD